VVSERVILAAIYDKSELDNLTDRELAAIAKDALDGWLVPDTYLRDGHRHLFERQCLFCVTISPAIRK